MSAVSLQAAHIQSPTHPPILIDALNIAYWRGTSPALELPMALICDLLQRGHRAQLLFDASTPYKLPATALDIYTQVLQHPDLATQVPSGRPADRQLLKLARSAGACIVSRDRFRDHRSRYRKLIDDPARRVDGFINRGILKVPSLGVEALVPATCAEAWATLAQVLVRGASRAANMHLDGGGSY